MSTHPSYFEKVTAIAVIELSGVGFELEMIVIFLASAYSQHVYTITASVTQIFRSIVAHHISKINSGEEGEWRGKNDKYKFSICAALSSVISHQTEGQDIYLTLIVEYDYP